MLRMFAADLPELRAATVPRERARARMLVAPSLIALDTNESIPSRKAFGDGRGRESSQYLAREFLQGGKGFGKLAFHIRSQIASPGHQSIRIEFGWKRIKIVFRPR